MRIGQRVITTMLLALALASQSAAQVPSLDLPDPFSQNTYRLPSPTEESAQALAGRVDPRQYIVGPGDRFDFNLSGRITRSFALVVGPEGSLYVPNAGAVPVTGLTLEQARQRVLQMLAGVYRGVSVDLRLSTVRSIRVHLTGLVRSPGTVELLASGRLSDVLNDSLMFPKSSRRNIQVIRHADGSIEFGDIERYRRTGDMRDDPFLWEGDVVQVPTATRFVFIEGAVAQPGRFELGPHDSLRTLIALAGGTLPSAANEGELQRFKDPTTREANAFDIGEILAGRADGELHDGDQALIRFQPRFHHIESVYIEGEVARPGPYSIQPGQTHLSALLERAGGFLDRADVNSLRIYRASSGAHEVDPEIDRLARLSRAEMTSSEYELFRARLSARQEDFRLDARNLASRPETDMLLLDGDIVRVMPLLSSVRVDGAVRRPGVIEFADHRDWRQYISFAGGFAARAATNQVRITRAGTGQTLFAQDVQNIEPGDLIWVPERGDSTFWHDFQQIILVAAQLATVVLAVRR